MTAEELDELLDALPFAARRADISARMLKAAKEQGFSSISQLARALYAVPVTHTLDDTSMHDIMKEIWESGYRFWDCRDPKLLTSFIDPHSGHWGKHVSDLKGNQPDVWGLIYRKYNENKEAGTLLGPKHLPPAAPLVVRR
jgi:hypothetical protein